VSAAEPSSAPPDRRGDVASLIPLVRRVVGARVADPVAADDLVQETLVRVLAAADRIAPGTFEAYAVVTARNLVASMWRSKDRDRRNQHRVVDLRPVEQPGEELLVREKQDAIAHAVTRLPDKDRQVLLAHEVLGQDTGSLAAEVGSSAGAVAAQLNRARARLRVEYLLSLERTEPPTDRCRPVLFALSAADSRRQRELDADRHLLGCALCARLSGPLLGRGQQRAEEVRIPIRVDGDVVAARQGVREMAQRVGFGRTDLTLVATAVSEIARNIVRFAGAGEVVVSLLTEPWPGIRVVARDTGPGIPDVELAMTDGFSTYHGLGLGLPGARRLMDEMTVESQAGRGTTVTMTKWRREGRP
jgi:RNA polymerase sigma factor (sigma-70 family)